MIASLRRETAIGNASPEKRRRQLPFREKKSS
jgi:hypothetical protein